MTENQDLNWGDDKRTFPRIAAWLQRLTKFKLSWEPPSITIGFFPPSLIINIPILWAKAETVVWPPAPVPVKPVVHFRIGWRRDMNVGMYFFTVALKREERTKLW